MKRFLLLFRDFKILFLLLIFTTIVLISSCKENISSPSVQQYGVSGRVVDTSGIPISDVQVYCLFNHPYAAYNYFPSISFQNKTANTDTFGFELKQNFPNTVYNSTLIRFSLPSSYKISLSIVQKTTGVEKFNYSNDYDYGYYQFPLINFVTDHQLTNGLYDISLKAARNGQVKYQANRTMFVVSDSGKPNLTTSNSGSYFFNYNDACIGETLISTYYYYQDDTTRISNNINLLFRKEGYRSEIRSYDMHPSLLFNQDIIMTKEN
jgi:hypothetical protein